jgi:hypothetical protein
VPAASPSALPFEYTWVSAVDPAAIAVPSAELQEDHEEEEEEEELLDAKALNETSDNQNAPIAVQPTQVSTEHSRQDSQGADAMQVEASKQAASALKVPLAEEDIKTEPKTTLSQNKQSPEAIVTNDLVAAADKSLSPLTASSQLASATTGSPSQEASLVKKKKAFTFADPMTPGDPPFTDACRTHPTCPPSGEWKGFFETLPRKSGLANIPVHEQCFLFLNATPPSNALIQFWDESQPPNETAKLKLPDGHILVRGMGENQYGKFELIGSYNIQTHLLTCQRIYVVIPAPKNNRKRAMSTGSNVGLDDLSGRTSRTRNKPTFSWKQRIQENTNFQAASLNVGGRRKRSRSEGTFGSNGTVGGKRLKIAIPEHSGSGSMETSLLTPGSVGAEGLTARQSPRGMSVHVSRKSHTLGSVGNGTIKLSSAGEPSKAHWRAAHFLYYHRDAPVTSASIAATTGAVTDVEAGSTTKASSSANTIPKAVVYEGEMYNGQRDCNGICLFNNGMLYEGSWRRNKEHGQGILMTADRKRIIYKGEWEKGKMHGRGIYFYGTDRRAKKEQKSGARFEGEFKENLKHGMGKYYFADGSVYDGSWRDGMMSGRGIFTWPDGSVYEGEWKDSKRHGQGVLKASDGFFYDGNWVANAMEGRGTAVYPNGQKYIGLFVCGRREGRGTMLFTNGATYEGRFRDDAIDGQGTLRLSRAMVVPREAEDESVEASKPDFMIPVSFQSDMGHIHRTAGFTLGGE